MNNNSKRLYFLDGIRGWGALSVLLYHVFVQAFPVSQDAPEMLRKLVFFNGQITVWIFFIVSGFSLSVGFIKTNNSEVLARIAVGRYLRLAIPIIAVAMAVKFLFLAGAIPPVIERPAPLTLHLLDQPTFLKALVISGYDVFFRPARAIPLIPPTWTMAFEFWGSFLILGTLLVVGKHPKRLLAYALVSVFAFTINPIYVAFVVGVIFAEIYCLSWNLKRIAVACLVIGLYLAYHIDNYTDETANHYLVTASILTFGFIFLPQSETFFSNALSRYLGKISFPLYLIHSSVLFAYAINVYHLAGAAPSFATKVVLNLSTVLVAIIAATCLVPFDRLSVTVSKRFSAFLLSKPKIDASVPESSR
jgi:peptidoglycan/LPS O-acetylase OafA/YrhL